MQLTKAFLIFWISLFHFFSGVYSAQAQTEQKKPTSSTQQNTTTETRTYTGEIPSPPTSPPAKISPVPGATLCKTDKPDYGNDDNPKKPDNQKEIDAKSGGQRIELHYVRDATNIKLMLEGIKKKLGMTYLEIGQRPEIKNEIILYGPEKERDCAYRIIAAIDLPRPGINMQMWGIQISTEKSKGRKALAEVMPEVRDRINLTQQLLRGTLAQLIDEIREIDESNTQKHGEQVFSPPETKSEVYKDLISNTLEYETAFNTKRPLSILDIISIGNSVENPYQFYRKIYDKLLTLITEEPDYHYYLSALQEKNRVPFERFFRSRGLEPPKWVCDEVPKKGKLRCTKWEWTEDKLASTNTNTPELSDTNTPESPRKKRIEKRAERIAEEARRLTLEFALQYGDFISNPNQFSPYDLQQTANALNGRLQDTTNALQQDIEEFFMLPTLSKIQEIVSKKKSVTYAQVGRTTAATLSGVKTDIGTKSVSAFDVTPPLKLSDLLTNASELQEQIKNFIPTETLPGAEAATEITLDGVLPVSKVIALMAAFAEQEGVFRELETGITLNFTPNVLRDLNSAELEIDLSITDPVASPTEEAANTQRQEGVKPLSRIGKQTVKTTVYTQAVDFFALSTFSNQSTLDGGRAYIPIVGQIWRGIFSAIPVFGDLFSWQRAPQNVQHESLLLTNSFITPTSMGLALLYPTTSDAYEGTRFCEKQYKVQEYLEYSDAIDNKNKCIKKRNNLNKTDMNITN